MLDSDYASQTCSIARALEVVGERWTLLILRDVLLGQRRFDELVASLGVTRTTLTNRLRKLEEHGLLERHRYQRGPDRYSYEPTAKAQELLPVLALLLLWGDRHYPNPAGPPRLLLHRPCGGVLTDLARCPTCDRPPTLDEVLPVPGPGAAT